MYRLQFGTADHSCTITTITSHTLYKETSPGWGFPRGRPLCSVWVSTVFSVPLPLVKHSNSGSAAKEKVGEAGAADPNVICDFAPTYNCSPLPTNDPGARAARSLAHHNQDPSTPGFLGKHEFLANVGLMLDHRVQLQTNVGFSGNNTGSGIVPPLVWHLVWKRQTKGTLHNEADLVEPIKRKTGNTGLGHGLVFFSGPEINRLFLKTCRRRNHAALTMR